MKKVAIIGANDFQNQLINKAKECGYETFVFAWESGAVGKQNADHFFPISIVDKELILRKCQKIGIDAICSIASDLAVITVNYVAEKMNLHANSIECSLIATNKFRMRNAFLENGDPIPMFRIAEENGGFDISGMKFPLIVKPTDRSGSRGIMKISDASQIESAVRVACHESFEHKALIEEFVEGKEYSVECISFHGEHTFLAVTEKITTGSPHFIETGHIQPVLLDEDRLENIKRIIFHALDSLKITDGASHSEIKIDGCGNVKIIEIGSRMGGDCIGSDLVRISTGYDFTKMVIDVALGNMPVFERVVKPRKAVVRFIFSPKDIEECEDMLCDGWELERKFIEQDFDGHTITDSSNRYGYYILKGEYL